MSEGENPDIMGVLAYSAGEGKIDEKKKHKSIKSNGTSKAQKNTHKN
jgi:hypothetical protein